MKQILFGLFFVFTLFSCKLNTKIKPPYEFQVLETEMAEIKSDPEPEIEIIKNDTLEFLKFWEKFFKHYQENDTSALIRLSFDSVNSPVFTESQNRFQPETEFVSIADFLNAQFRKKLPLLIIPFSKKDPFYIVYRYTYNPDTQNIRSKKDSVLLNYYVLVDTKEIKDHYEIPRTFSLSFIKKNNSIRFSGLEIQGEGYFRPLNDSTTRARLYFPLYRETQDPKTNLNSLDTLVNLWYSAYLSDFKELNLHKYTGEDDVYRFTWLRSFHNPVTIRFQKHGNDYILTTKEMTYSDEYIPNKIITNTTQYLTAPKWNKLEFKLGRYNFWNKPSIDPEPRSMDGAEWVLETNVKGKYHFINRQSPDGELRECCKYLLFLSKLKVAKEDIY